jgi:hypothetical protein
MRRSCRDRCCLGRRLLALAVGWVLLALPAAGRAQGTVQSSPAWSAPLNLSLSAGRSSWPIVQEDPASGDLLVVWTDFSTDPYGEIMLRRRLGPNGDWTATLNLSARPGWDGGPMLFADPSGQVHLAWTRRDAASGSDLLYRLWDGVSWSEAQVLYHTDTFMPSAYGLIFVQDAAGRTCLFVSVGSGIARTCRGEQGWEPLPPWVYVPYIESFGAIILGPDGLFHAAALGPNEGGQSGCDPWLNDVYYVTGDGTSWTVWENLSGQGSIAYDAALAFDPQGHLHLFWTDISPFCSYDSEKSALYERVRVGQAWGPRLEVTSPDDEEGQAVEDMSLAVDPAGQFHLAWSEGLFDAQGAAVDLSIRYRCLCGGNWGPEEGVLVPAKESINVDLAVGKEGLPAAVWEEGEPKEIFFSERDLAHWKVFLPLLPRG